MPGSAISCKFGWCCSSLGNAGLRLCNVTVSRYMSWAESCAEPRPSGRSGRSGAQPAAETPTVLEPPSTAAALPRFQPPTAPPSDLLGASASRRTSLAISGYRILDTAEYSVHALAASFSTFPIHRSPDQSINQPTLPHNQSNLHRPTPPPRTTKLTRNPEEPTQPTPQNQPSPQRPLYKKTNPAPPRWRRGTTPS